MWTTVLSWAASLWPILWRFMAPLLQDQLRKDLEFVLPLAERMVGAVERAYGWRGQAGDEKRKAAERLIRTEIDITQSGRAQAIPLSTVNLAIELALKKIGERAVSTPSAGPANASTPPPAGSERPS